MHAWQKLIESDPRFIRFNDDAEVKRLIFDAGLAGVFSEKPGKYKHTVYSSYGKHPTHWILFGFYHSHPHPADNGYTALCLSKKHFTKAQAQAFIDRFLSVAMENVDGGYTIPAENNFN